MIKSIQILVSQLYLRAMITQQKDSCKNVHSLYFQVEESILFTMEELSLKTLKRRNTMQQDLLNSTQLQDHLSLVMLWVIVKLDHRFSSKIDQ